MPRLAWGQLWEDQVENNKFIFRPGTFEMCISHLNGDILEVEAGLRAFKTRVFWEIATGVRGLSIMSWCPLTFRG